MRNRLILISFLAILLGCKKHPKNIDSPTETEPYQSPGDQYFISPGSGFFSYNLRDNSEKWKQTDSNANTGFIIPVLSNDTLFNVSNGNVQAVKIQNGKILWTINVNGSSSTSLSVGGGFLFVNTSNYLYALNVKNGKRAWAENFGERTSYTPIYINGRLLTMRSSMTTFSTSVVAHDPATGTVLWSNNIPVPLAYPLAVGSGRIFEQVPGPQGNWNAGIWSFDAYTGKGTGSFNYLDYVYMLSELPTGRPVSYDQTVFSVFWFLNLSVTANNINTGQLIWKKSLTSASNVLGMDADGTGLYVISDIGINKYQLATGELLWSDKIKCISDLTIVKDKIYVNALSSSSTPNSNIYALTSFDATTGEKLAELQTFTEVIKSAPVFLVDNMVYYPSNSAMRKGP